MFYTVPH